MCRTLDKKAFEELLLYLRNQNEITQKTLSDILNTTSTTISKWENGNCAPDIDALFRIADYFHLTLDDLFYSAETLSRLQNGESYATSPIEILTKAKPKKKKWVLIGILLVLFLSIGAGTIIGYFVGVKYQTTQGTKASVLPCTLISQEYIVDEMYGYTLLLQYATPVKYEEAQLEEYACILFQEWSENKEIEEGVNFISLSFRLDNETTPYYVWGKMITS